MVIDSQKLVSILKAQHRKLQTDLSLVLDELKADIMNGDNIIIKLANFKNDLIEHTRLENSEFYTDYLDKKTKNGEDITSTKKFISQMNDIEKTAMTFLEKYNNSEVVKANKTVFRTELDQIISTLNMRIETEEEGVFDFY